MNSHLLPLYICHKGCSEKLLKYQLIDLVWSCPQISSPIGFIKHWYHKENFDTDHSYGLKGLSSHAYTGNLI